MSLKKKKKKWGTGGIPLDPYRNLMQNAPIFASVAHKTENLGFSRKHIFDKGYFVSGKTFFGSGKTLRLTSIVPRCRIFLF